ncbi:MAG: hypothetical protein M3445_04970 [Actinomycetota bacterium]|nr:hypothetical protein [Actinomycetota bacterium]
MTSVQITTSYDVRVPMRDGVELAVDIWPPQSEEPQHVFIGGNHDALHLAIAGEIEACTLVTSDSDFGRLRKLPFPLQVTRS